MTSKGPTSLKAEQPRQGKWTKEEESYVDLLIEEFRYGALPLREGTTLRSFLSKMINCNPKRVSKKYENTNYNGKHKYEPSTIPMSLEEMRRRRERLQDYERRFLQALKRSEDDLEMDEEQLKASLEESRSAVSANEKAATEKEDRAMAALLKQHKEKTAASTKSPSFVNNGFQDRLTAELQARMDFANQLAGSGGGGPGTDNSTDVRDLSLSNTANMTLTLPSAFASPRTTGKPQVSGCNGINSLNQLASYDLMSSLKQSNPSYANNAAMGSLARHVPELEEDPLGWQVRIQRRAAGLMRDRTSFAAMADKAEAPFPLPQYLHQSKFQDDALMRVTGDMPFPTLPDPERRRHLHPAGTMDQLSQFQLASLVAREERRCLSSSSTGLGADRFLGATRRSSLVSELEMMESLKRGRERQEVMDSFRPLKRLR